MSFIGYSNRNMSITQTQLSYISTSNSIISSENDKTVKSYIIFCDNKLKENNQYQNNISSNNFSSNISQSHNKQLYTNIINIFNNNSCPDFIMKEKKEKENIDKIKIDFEKLNKKYENLQKEYYKIILENQEIKKN